MTGLVTEKKTCLDLPFVPHADGNVVYIKGERSPTIKCGYYDRATPEKFFGVSIAYVRSLEGSQKAG